MSSIIEMGRRMETELSGKMRLRARAIREAGGLGAALRSGGLEAIVETSLSEALVLGLLRQGVRKYLADFRAWLDGPR